MGTLILARHATTEASAAGRNLGGRSDLPLNAAGVELAERLTTALVAELVELPHDELRILSSPATRCRQTADPIRGAILRGGEVELLDGLREIDYGAWDGLTPEEARTRDPELRVAWEADPWTTACPGGESGQDVARRAFAALEPIEGWLAADRSRCAIVVAHNHVLRIRLCALFGWPMREYRDRLSQDPGGYSIVGLGTGAPVVRRLNVHP